VNSYTQHLRAHQTLLQSMMRVIDGVRYVTWQEVPNTLWDRIKMWLHLPYKRHMIGETSVDKILQGINHHRDVHKKASVKEE
jgi:hypothetical protein